MARIRKGDKKVLLVVDVQRDVLSNLWDNQRIIHNINSAVEKARANDVPVIWVQHEDQELIVDSPGWQIVPELSPAADETRIYKQFNSAFEETPLEEILKHQGAAHIILAGAATNWCIRATAYAALERGYDLTLIKDAHTTNTISLADGINIEAEQIIEELNLVMNWVSYSGRRNCSKAVAEVEFSAA